MSIKFQSNFKAFALCFGFFSLTYLTSCREHETLDPEMVPGVDNINTFGLNDEDLEASMNIVYFDSQVTNNPSLPIGVVGNLVGDPTFGDIDAGFFFQVTVPSVGYSFPEDVRTFDSVRLVLPYTGATYGDTTGMTRVEVYEINDPSFTIDTTTKSYYSFSDVSHYPTSIGSVEKRIHDVLKDTLVYSTTQSVRAQMAIKLSPAFLAKIKAMTPSNMLNHYAFVDYINGFYIKAASSTPAFNKSLHYFVLNGSGTSYNQARMEVHYTKNDGTFGVTLFPFNVKYSSFFSKLDRNYAGYPIESYTSGDVTDTIFVQGGPGFQTDITLKNLSQMNSKDRIYAARLTLNMPKTSVYDHLKNPPLLLVNGVNEDGTLYALADYQTSLGISATAEMLALAQQFVGGTPVESIIDGQDHLTYYINIPREIQRHIALGKDSIKLRIYPYYDYIGAYRFIAPGFNTTSNAKAKFNIVYGKQ